MSKNKKSKNSKKRTSVSKSSETQSTQARPAKSKKDKAKPAKSGLLGRRAVLKSSLGIGALIAGGAWIHRHDTIKRQQHDLSAIGAGNPVVLQVHDPSCPSCRALMRSTKAALDDKPAIDYRIADLTTDKGREIGQQYSVGKVTLLLFDKKGDHVGTVQGVRSVDELNNTFNQYFSL